MNKITKYCVDNPDEITENIAKKFKVSNNVAFACVKEAGRILSNNNKKNE